jgi:2-oxoglutarate dehydrogenase E2 component (dihydrolipoamide succinyltransferase)
MARTEVLMPKMGESVAEATVIKWLKNVGDSVALDEPIMEIATDKVDSEIPSPVAGILAEQCCKENDVVQVGRPVAVLTTDAAEAAPSAPATPISVAAVTTPTASAAPVVSAGGTEVGRTGPSGRFYSPLVRNIAKEEGISLEELELVPGTGQDGRVTKHDMLSYMVNRGAVAPVAAPIAAASAPVVAAPIATAPVSAAPAVVYKANITLMDGDEVVEMDRMRKMIAEHMTMSKHTSAHVTSFVEADVTNIVLWRDRNKAAFEKREGEKLTFTPIFIEAVARAIKEFPGVNVSVDGDRIIRRKQINIGMAAALPTGNLIVPVIRNADQKNLIGLSKEVNDLAGRARAGKLKPEEIQGGTYTLSNVGTFGNVMGTPVINQPQVAILAVGAIRKKPAVIETPQGDLIGIRHMMFLSHSYDHRVVDGSLGGMFVRRVADLLESWDPERTI